MLFRNRYDAAHKLLPYLEKFQGEQGIVFAVPRGGVPLGFCIAKHYHLPLELLLTKKIGHPESDELAVGAVSLEDRIIDERYNIPSSYIEKETTHLREILQVQYKKFMGNGHSLPEVKNKNIIIVDDGVATGNTILAALKMMRKKNPKKIIVTVPVAPPETIKKLRPYADDFICLHSTADFFGVGQFYMDFSEVADEEVIRLLKEANQMETAGGED